MYRLVFVCLNILCSLYRLYRVMHYMADNIIVYVVQ